MSVVHACGLKVDESTKDATSPDENSHYELFPIGSSSYVPPNEGVYKYMGRRGELSSRAYGKDN